MAPSRWDKLPAANKTFVDRVTPKAAFERAAFSIPSDRAKILVFYGVGGEGKTALCREFLRMTTKDPSFAFLRSAHLDLHGRPKDDPDLLLVWIRNSFSAAGVPTPCFDLSLALMWASGRQEQPFPKLRQAWLARHSNELQDVLAEVGTTATETLGEAAKAVPGIGILIKNASEWAIRRGYTAYLHRTRDALARLYLSGELKQANEISQLLPWMLAQDFNYHLARHSGDRFALFVDEYERVFDQGGLGSRWKENRFDQHLRILAQETNGLLLTFFSRERLPWEADPDWAADLADAQHLLGGLGVRDADQYLREVPIEEDAIRHTMIKGASDQTNKNAPVYPILLDLQVEHWRSLKASGSQPKPEEFELASQDYSGLIRTLIERLLRDYGPSLQATLTRLSCARFFDKVTFSEIVRGFSTGVPVDSFEQLALLSFISKSDEGFLSFHGLIRESVRNLLSPEFIAETREFLFWHFAHRASRRGEDLFSLSEAAYFGDLLGFFTDFDIAEGDSIDISNSLPFPYLPHLRLSA